MLTCWICLNLILQNIAQFYKIWNGTKMGCGGFGGGRGGWREGNLQKEIFCTEAHLYMEFISCSTLI